MAGGIAGLGSIGVGRVSADEECGIPQDYGSAEEENPMWEISDSDSVVQNEYYNDKAQQIRCSLIYIQSEYNARDNWEHYFAAAAHTVTKSKYHSAPDSQYQKDELVTGHSLNLNNMQPTTASIMSTNNPYAGHVGAYPPDTSSPADPDYPPAAFSVIGGALALATGSPYLAVGTTAFAAFVVLTHSGEGSSDPTEQDYEWSYDDDYPCEAVHFCQFSLECGDGNSSASVETTFNGPDWGYSGSAEVQFWNTVDADPPDTCGPGSPYCPTDDQSAEISPEIGTREYRRYLDNSSFARQISPDESLDPDITSDTAEKPIYVSRNPRVRGGIGSKD